MKVQIQISRVFASIAFTFIVLWLPCVGGHANAAVIISEFMAENSNGLRDEDGDRPDWIEIFNSDGADLNLGGWFLTDNGANLTKWRFPTVTLPPNGFLLIWASGKNRTNAPTRLHANFRLEKNGEFLALVDPATNVASAFSPTFPAQQADISYGRDSVDPMVAGYFSNPTPGTLNSTSGEGIAAEPILSLESGVYTNDSLTLTIEAAPNALVYYTLDGSAPTFGSSVYSGPIVLSNNVTIKAMAYQPDFWISPIAACTVVFLDASSRDFNSNLPLMILNAGGPVPAEVPPGGPRRNGGLIVIDNQTGRASLRDAPQFAGLAAFELFGQTSLSFAKLPHRIEVQDGSGKDLNVSLLGLPADADWQTDGERIHLRRPFKSLSLLASGGNSGKADTDRQPAPNGRRLEWRRRTIAVPGTASS